MQLVERNKLSLDDRLAKYYPAFPNAATISVRELLNHTSGIPDYFPYAFSTGKFIHPTTPDEIILAIAGESQYFPAGSDWNYSNTEYVMLGQIVEKISGESLQDYERKHIFLPLGMKRTGVRSALSPKIAAPFKGDPGDWSWYYAAGDLFSTPSDLARFDIALMSGELLPVASFEEMGQTVPYATLEPGLRDGLGLFVTDEGPNEIVGHHGGEPGFRADNEMIPSRGFAAIVLGNGPYDTTPIVDAAIHAYFPNHLGIAATFARANYDADPAITERAAAFLKMLIQGNADRSELEPLASINIPGRDTLIQQFAPFGELKRLRFMSRVRTDSGILYTYQAVFVKRSLILQFSIDKANKYASFALT